MAWPNPELPLFTTTALACSGSGKPRMDLVLLRLFLELGFRLMTRGLRATDQMSVATVRSGVTVLQESTGAVGTAPADFAAASRGCKKRFATLRWFTTVKRWPLWFYERPPNT